MAKRIDVSIHGRMLGTASGWDGEPGKCVWFYDFKPNEGIKLPAGDLQYHELNGYIGLQNSDTGNIDNPIDAPTFLVSISRKA